MMLGATGAKGKNILEESIFPFLEKVRSLGEESTSIGSTLQIKKRETEYSLDGASSRAGEKKKKGISGCCRSKNPLF